jgi:hypothetical protein
MGSPFDMRRGGEAVRRLRPLAGHHGGPAEPRRLLEWPTRCVPVEYHGDLMVADRSVLAEHIAARALKELRAHPSTEAAAGSAGPDDLTGPSTILRTGVAR